MERAARYGRLPTIGTHEWLDLPDGDPRKVGAIYSAALQYVLRAENQQLAMIEAADAVRPASDWTAVMRCQRQRREFLRDNADWAQRRPA